MKKNAKNSYRKNFNVSKIKKINPKKRNGSSRTQIHSPHHRIQLHVFHTTEKQQTRLVLVTLSSEHTFSILAKASIYTDFDKM